MTKKQVGHVPGNTLASQAEMDRMLYGFGRTVTLVDFEVRKYLRSGNPVKALRFKAPDVEGGDWMAIVTVTLDGAAAVAFVFGSTFGECLRTLANKMENGSIQWKEDQYG